MRTLSKLLTGIVLLLVLLSCAVSDPLICAYAATETPVENAQYSVVRVVCVTSETYDGFYYSFGTGFAVGNSNSDARVFVTNSHVVEENTSSVYITITDMDQLIPVEVIYQDETRDIAILELSTPISERHPITLLSSTELNKAQDVFCLGFPGLMDEFSDKEASSTISDITITKGSVSNPEFSVGGVTTILSDAKVNHGNSGGPMVDEYGRAVGINTAFIGDGSGQNMSCAVSIDYVMEALDSLGLPYEEGQGGGATDVESSEEEEETPNNTAEASASEPSAASPAPTTPEAGSKRVGGTQWLLIYAVFVVAALGGTFLYLKLNMSRKHRKAEEQARLEPERQRREEEKRKRQEEEERKRREGAGLYKNPVIENGSKSEATSEGGTDGGLKFSMPAVKSRPDGEISEFHSPSLIL